MLEPILFKARPVSHLFSGVYHTIHDPEYVIFSIIIVYQA